MGFGMTDHDAKLELINAEIDGVLTGPQRAELNRLVLADPSLRALRDDLIRTCRDLDALPREELPAGLHEQVLACLPPVESPRAAVQRGVPFLRRPLMRYAATFVGGLLAATLAYQFGSFVPTQVGAGQLAGTIADAGHAEARMVVDLDDVQGEITLTGPPASPQVVTSLHSARPVSIVTRLHDDGMVEVQVVDEATSVVLQRGKLRLGPDR
jgi:anti-sigma factor RsiW